MPGRASVRGGALAADAREGRRRADRRAGARARGSRGRPRRPRARSRRAARPTRCSPTPTSRCTPTTPCHVKTGRVEIGQGSTTGLLLLVAEELDMNVDQLVFVRQDTNVTPEHRRDLRVELDRPAGQRAASARARPPGRALLALASQQLGVPAASPHACAGGVVSGGGRSVTYGALVGGRLLGVPLPAPILDPGQAPAKPISAYRLVGHLADAAPRHPGEGRRAPTPTSTTSGCPGCCTAASSGRSGRGPTATGRSPGSSRSTSGSIAGLGDARVVRRGDFARRRRLAGVRRDPGGRAARGRLPQPARDLREREPVLGRCATLDAAGLAPPRTQVQEGDVDAAIAARGAHGRPELRLPLPGPHADRPELRDRAT